jgi:hypothetical protein
MTHVVSDNRTFENVEFLNKNENHIIFFMTINVYFLDFDININLPFSPGYIFYLLWPGVSDENGNHGSVCNFNPVLYTCHFYQDERRVFKKVETYHKSLSQLTKKIYHYVKCTYHTDGNK